MAKHCNGFGAHYTFVAASAGALSTKVLISTVSDPLVVGVDWIVLSDVAGTEIYMPAAAGANAGALSMRVLVGTVSNPLVAGINWIVLFDVAGTGICMPAGAGASASVGAGASSMRVLVGTDGIV